MSDNILLNKKLCSLCKSKRANQKNSHIIPKCLVDGVRKHGSKRRIYLIDLYRTNNKYQFKQDTPKEDFILCSECEMLIANKIETPFKNQFFDLMEDPSNYYNINIWRKSVLYRLYLMFDYQKFKIFAYSILLRIHFSNLKGFQHINLGSELVSKLTETVHKQIITVNFPILVLATDVKNTQDYNLIGAVKPSDDDVFVFCNSMVFIFGLSDNSVFISRFKDAAIHSDNNIRVMHINVGIWREMNNLIWEIKAQQDLFKKQS